MTNLIVPGLSGSGPGHWQHWWLEADPTAALVDQADFDTPRLEPWIDRLNAAIEAAPGAVVVAHSLGVALLLQTALRRPLPIAGALLVAPADVGDPLWTTPLLGAFGPLPEARLDFPAIVVASRNDPYCAFGRATALAARWGASLVDLGAAGHINTASGFGPWPRGLELAAGLRRSGQQGVALQLGLDGAGAGA